MNYPPPTSPTPASARNSRAERHRRSGEAQSADSRISTGSVSTPERHRRSQRSASGASAGKRSAAKRAPKRRAKASAKKKQGVTWWQILILAAMAVAVIALSCSMSDAQSTLRKLETEKEARLEAEEARQKEIRSYQVRYRDLIERYAAQYRLEPAYVAAIIKRESDYDPRAVSNKDARGLMQMMPATFEWVRNNCGYRNQSIDVLFEPEAAIKMGCYLLRYICDYLKTDDPIIAACAYHAGWGESGVSYWLKHYSSDGKTLTLSQIPADDTRYYARKVQEAYAIYQQYYY